MQVEFPGKLRCLFQASRYKFIRGGRGGGKSWSAARALLIRAAERPLRVLCTREIQRSIKDSVHRLLADQVQELGLGGFYEVLQTEIRGRNGSLFLFSGLSDLTAESIKSFEGCDIVWIEEARSVSKRSLNILTPTIRKEGSEIWATYNPELETDPIHQMAENPPPDSIVVEINYRDNPWFPAVLEQERQHAQRTMPEAEYRHIWEGQCLPAVIGAIYANEIAQAEADGRICNVPYDPALRVHVVFDLGWNDAMAISLVQRHGSEIRIIRYIEDSHRTLADYSAELRALRMNWGRVWLPHDGFNGDFKTGQSSAAILRQLGWDVAGKEEIANLSVEEGIRQTRMVFPRLYIDKTHCARLVECVKRYRRAINARTQEAGAPLHDEYSHGADNLRYVAVNVDRMTNEEWGGALPTPRLGIV